MQVRVTLAVVLALALSVGCGGGARSDRFEVALVTPGPVSDGGWNAAAYAGLARIGSEMGASTSHLEASSPAQFEEAFRDYAQRGFDLVFGHGFEFSDAAVTVGAGFPRTAFAVTSSRTVAPNVAGLVFRLEESAYLAGVLAAKVSSSGVVGAVGGMEIPPVRLVFDGFRRGVLDTRPDASVRTVFLGNWEDVAGARQATLALVDAGADVVIHNADAAGLGVFQACRERGVLALGTNTNQAGVAPDVVLASAVMDIPAAMLRVAEDVRSGRFVGRVYTFDLASGVVDLTLNPALAERVTPEARSALDDARRRIVAGEVGLEHFGG